MMTAIAPLNHRAANRANPTQPCSHHGKDEKDGESDILVNDFQRAAGQRHDFRHLYQVITQERDVRGFQSHVSFGCAYRHADVRCCLRRCVAEQSLMLMRPIRSCFQQRDQTAGDYMAAVSGVRCAQGIARPFCHLRSTLTPDTAAKALASRFNRARPVAVHPLRHPLLPPGPRRSGLLKSTNSLHAAARRALHAVILMAPRDGHRREPAAGDVRFVSERIRWSSFVAPLGSTIP